MRNSSLRRWALGVTLIAMGAAGTGSEAQGQRTIGIRVQEAAGIRRTEYPLRARVSLNQGEARDPAGLHLRLAADPVAAQLTVLTRWPDGSARDVDVDFNASLAPGETRLYQLVAGQAGAAGPPARGLTVTEEADLIRIGNAAYSRSADPLMRSAAYVRREFIGASPESRNGLALIDSDGARHDLSSSPQVNVAIGKRGPLMAELVYAGDVPVGGGRSARVALTVEMPSSKSWVRLSASVGDESRRVREVILETPLAVGAFPWQWDIGTENGTYGAFRNAPDAMRFHQIVSRQGNPSWRIETGTDPDLRPYEVSTTQRRAAAGVWGHLIGPDGAVAFGIPGTADAPGTYTVALDGRGQASYRFAPIAGAGTTLRLVVYQHFVSTPVPIGAATTPASMLNPPRVIVE